MGVAGGIKDLVTVLAYVYVCPSTCTASDCARAQRRTYASFLAAFVFVYNKAPNGVSPVRRPIHYFQRLFVFP